MLAPAHLEALFSFSSTTSISLLDALLPVFASSPPSASPSRCRRVAMLQDPWSRSGLPALSSPHNSCGAQVAPGLHPSPPAPPLSDLASLFTPVGLVLLLALGLCLSALTLIQGCLLFVQPSFFTCIPDFLSQRQILCLWLGFPRPHPTSSCLARGSPPMRACAQSPSRLPLSPARVRHPPPGAVGGPGRGRIRGGSWGSGCGRCPLPGLPLSSPLPVFSCTLLLPSARELSPVPGAASFPPGSPLPRPPPPQGRRDGGGVWRKRERRERPRLGWSPDSRGGGTGGGERWRRKEGGAGRSGRAWGLEARESRGAGPARRGKSQGPGERGLERGARGRAEPGGRGTGGDGEPRGRNRGAMRRPSRRAWVSRAPASRGGRGRGGGERWSPGRVGGPREAGGGWGQAFSPPLPPPRAGLRPRLLRGAYSSSPG